MAPDRLSTLPNELLLNIFSYFDYFELKRFFRVNKRVHDLLNDPTKFGLVDVKLFRDFPNEKAPSDVPFMEHPLLGSKLLSSTFPKLITIPRKLILSEHPPDEFPEEISTLYNSIFYRWRIRRKPILTFNFTEDNLLYPANTRKLFLKFEFSGSARGTRTCNPEVVKRRLLSTKSDDQPYDFLDVLWKIFEVITSFAMLVAQDLDRDSLGAVAASTADSTEA